METKNKFQYIPKDCIMEFRAGFCGKTCDSCGKEVVWFFARNLTEVLCEECAYTIGIAYRIEI